MCSAWLLLFCQECAPKVRWHGFGEQMPCNQHISLNIMSERKASVIDNSGWVDSDYLGWNIDTTVENLFYSSGDIWCLSSCL